jgi:hypothetical protein
MAAVSADVQEAFREAILKRLQVEIDYQGKRRARGARLLDPHAIYRTGNDHLYVHAFQVDGVSTSGELPDWRRFDLEEISRVEPLDSHFELAAGYDPSDRMYSAGLLVAAS